MFKLNYNDQYSFIEQEIKVVHAEKKVILKLKRIDGILTIVEMKKNHPNIITYLNITGMATIKIQ